MCTTQSLVRNVVIGVLLGELHVVRVDPVVVCDDVVVRRTLVLIALCRNHCFHRIHFFIEFCCMGNLQIPWRGGLGQ